MRKDLVLVSPDFPVFKFAITPTVHSTLTPKLPKSLSRLKGGWFRANLAAPWLLALDDADGPRWQVTGDVHVRHFKAQLY